MQKEATSSSSNARLPLASLAHTFIVSSTDTQKLPHPQRVFERAFAPQHPQSGLGDGGDGMTPERIASHGKWGMGFHGYTHFWVFKMIGI